MALSTLARRTLSHAVQSAVIGDEIADIIDAGSGTLSTLARTKIGLLVGQNAGIGLADGIADAIDAGAALEAAEQAALGVGLANRVVAQEIATALSAS
jgi:hypothetical protein